MTAAGIVSPRRVAWAWAAGLLLGAPGCTICPDPFDYSGPVPNGSAPQNDFRARSNGVLPIGGVPRPWPPVVNVEPDRADERGVTVPALEMADEASPPEAAGVIQPATAAVPEAAEPDTADVPAIDPQATDALLLPTPGPRPDETPAGSETPGWRSRD